MGQRAEQIERKGKMLRELKIEITGFTNVSLDGYKGEGIPTFWACKS